MNEKELQDKITSLEAELEPFKNLSRWDWFHLAQHSKTEAHIKAMKEAGIWPKDLDDLPTRG